MTDKPYGLDFFDKIVNVQFGNGGGLVFCQLIYALNSQSVNIPPRPSAQLITAAGGPADILGSVNKLVGKTKGVAVVNPVSDAMMKGLYQWTPAPLYEQTAVAKHSSTGVWYVDGSNQDPNLVTPVPTPSNYNNFTYFVPGSSFPTRVTDVNPTPGDNGFATGLTVIQYRAPAQYFFVITNNNLTVGPNGFVETFIPTVVNTANIYPSAAAAQAASDFMNAQFAIERQASLVRYPAFVVGPLVPPTQVGSSVRNGTAVFILNYGELKAAQAAAGNKGLVTFTVNVGGIGATGSCAVNAAGYKTLRNFQLNASNSPMFSPWSPSGASLAGGTVTGSIHPDLSVTF